MTLYLLDLRANYMRRTGWTYFSDTTSPSTYPPSTFFYCAILRVQVQGHRMYLKLLEPSSYLITLTTQLQQQELENGAISDILIGEAINIYDQSEHFKRTIY